MRRRGCGRWSAARCTQRSRPRRAAWLRERAAQRPSAFAAALLSLCSTCLGVQLAEDELAAARAERDRLSETILSVAAASGDASSLSADATILRGEPDADADARAQLASLRAALRAEQAQRASLEHEWRQLSDACTELAAALADGEAEDGAAAPAPAALPFSDVRAHVKSAVARAAALAAANRTLRAAVEDLQVDRRCRCPLPRSAAAAARPSAVHRATHGAQHAAAALPPVAAPSASAERAVRRAGARWRCAAPRASSKWAAA